MGSKEVKVYFGGFNTTYWVGKDGDLYANDKIGSLAVDGIMIADDLTCSMPFQVSVKGMIKNSKQQIFRTQ
jgi:hypothetical protein